MSSCDFSNPMTCMYYGFFCTRSELFASRLTRLLSTPQLILDFDV